jgi:putative ABC transport system permease protein
VKALDRKVLRDLARMKGQAVAIALLVTCAVSVFTGSVATYRSLLVSQHGYYKAYAFADIFARLVRAPEALGEKIAAIPGVASVETRVTADAALEIEGFSDPVTALLVSIPADGRPRLNRLHLRSGRLPAPGAAFEVLVGEAFAKAHRIRPGDTLAAIINGRRQRLVVTGVALSPEHVYTVRPGDLMPDDRRFGVIWMPRGPLAAATNMAGAFNDVTLRLVPGAKEIAVVAAFDRILAPFGGFGAGGRDQNVSHRFLSDEIRQQKSTAVIVPTIFLGVAAFLLNVVMSRLVSTQREQLAALKAFGYSSLDAGLHYLKMVAIIVAAGCVPGAVLGWLMTEGMMAMYADYYRLPAYIIESEPWLHAAAFAIATVASFAGVLGAVRRAVSLPPAEAMRPPAPPTYRPTLIERLGAGALLSHTGRIVARNIGRRPVRALLSAFGIACSCALLMSGLFFEDTMTHMMDLEFSRAWRGDLAVAFHRAVPARAAFDLAHLPGVGEVEPYRAVAVTLKNGHRSYNTAINGYVPNPRLRRLLGPDERPLAIPENGLMLTRLLAEKLDLAPGDTVEVAVLEGARQVRRVAVTALSDELLGLQGYMTMESLNRLLGERDLVSGATVMAAAPERASLFAKLRRMPGVAGVTIREMTMKTFNDMMAQIILVFAGILFLFAVVMTAGVVYNSARVSLAERERELATLRVIGFTRGEVSRILLGEIGVYTVAAIPLGFLLGWGLCWFAAWGLENDIYRVPLVFERSTFGLSAAVVIAATAATALAVSRRLSRLDLVEVLKTKE